MQETKSLMFYLLSAAEAEVRRKTDKKIILASSAIPANHLYAIRGEYCDFYETQYFVVMYLKPLIPNP